MCSYIIALPRLLSSLADDHFLLALLVIQGGKSTAEKPDADVVDAEFEDVSGNKG